jgi:L-2-hydroxycarboxylate dehydrogenase (NAD+)
LNVVPEEFIRVMPEPMRAFISSMFEKVGMSEQHADLMGDLLVATDLRGVFSHGTRQSAGYLRNLKEGNLNPKPETKVVQDSPATAVIDGDGSLGHIASWEAANLLVEKTKEIGLGAVTTRNHHHFGSAGKYSRVPCEAGYVGFVVSSHVRRFQPESSLGSAGGSSPMSFAIPSGDEPPLILDMGTSFAFPRSLNFEEIFQQMPAAFFKSLGLGTVCHTLGGLMAGIQSVEEEGSDWPAVNQGSFMMAVDLSRFFSPETFSRQMDQFIRDVQALKPFPGEDRALLPGHLEWERTRDWAVEGIPVGNAHQETLTSIGEELNVETPF